MIGRKIGDMWRVCGLVEGFLGSFVSRGSWDERSRV